MYCTCRLDDSLDLSCSIKELLKSLTELLECHEPSKKPTSPLHTAFGLLAEHEIPITVSKDDCVWLLAHNLTREVGSCDERPILRVRVWSSRKHEPQYGLVIIL